MTTQIEAKNLSIIFPMMGRKALLLNTKRLNHGNNTHATDHFVAIDDISLSVKSGDRIGILGNNGAGKSTLLRALAGIYVPAKGTVKTAGKIRSLFSISVGLDTDANGYENIPLLAAAHGIPLSRIPDIFDDVVDFCELGDALERPIRTYSTGMRLRLAFAVVTALPSDSFLMDEIIAVGDGSFVAKSRARTMKLAEGADTLILASHAEGYLRALCNKGIVIEKGKIAFEGPIEDAIKFHGKGK